MTKLDCNVVNCSYNEDNCCRREDIHVEGMKAKMPSETSCGSFAARGCGCATNKMGEPEKDTNVVRAISVSPEAMQTAVRRQSAEALSAAASA